MLLASIISSTDSASVFSILRSKKISLKNNLKPLLELESGSNDPMAFMLTLIFIKMTLNGDLSVFGFIFSLLYQFSIGLLCGFILARVTLFFISKVQFDNRSLYHIMLLSSMFFTYSFTNLINGNGFLAVYIAGLTIGNSKVQCDSSAYTFFDGFAWLSQLILFLTLGLLVNPNELIKADVAGIGIIVALSLVFFSRPIAVFASLLPFKGIPVKSRHFISWVGLRGAVPIVFATYPLIAGVDHAGHIFNIVFFITIISLLFQGTTINLIAGKLGLLDQ
jgi:cell volume regulation protein A